jgi:hypothetical protein
MDVDLADTAIGTILADLLQPPSKIALYDRQRQQILNRKPAIFGSTQSPPSFGYKHYGKLLVNVPEVAPDGHDTLGQGCCRPLYSCRYNGPDSGHGRPMLLCPSRHGQQTNQ